MSLFSRAAFPAPEGKALMPAPAVGESAPVILLVIVTKRSEPGSLE
jgi:hypothetical protein